MSTKTTFKRVAAVAAAALAISGFSAVSANAAVGNITADTGFTFGGTATAATATATAGTNNYVAFALEVGSSPIAVNVTGGTAVTAATTVTGSGTSALVASGSGSSVVFNVPTPVVGTITVKTYGFTAGVQSATATSSLTITVNAAATGVGVISTGNSTAYVTESATVGGITSWKTGGTPALTAASAATAFAALSVDDTTAVDKGTVGSAVPAAIIVGKLMDSQINGGSAMTNKTLTATISGSGLLVGNSTHGGALATTPARVATTVSGDGTTSSTNGVYAFGVYTDGSAGVGTITVSYTDTTTNVTTVVATKTVTFYGAAATFTATQKAKYISNSGNLWPASATSTAGTYAVKIVVTDSAGNPVGGVTPSAKVSAVADQAFVSSATCTPSTYTTGASYCSVQSVANAADGSGTVTFYTGATTSFNYVSVDVPFTVVSPKAASVTVTADQTVSSGQVVTYTIVAKDSAGNPVPDYSVALNYLAGSPTVAGGALQDYSSTANAGLSSNAVSALFAGVNFLNGTATDSLQAPFGSTSLVATFDGVGGGAAVIGGTYYTTAAAANFETVLTTVAGGDSAVQAATDAAQEATDAANAAYDAANNAMDSADAATAAAQDASDNASAALAAVTSLSATVAKLVKSVAAIAAALAKVQKKIGA